MLQRLLISSRQCRHLGLAEEQELHWRKLLHRLPVQAGRRGPQARLLSLRPGERQELAEQKHRKCSQSGCFLPQYKLKLWGHHFRPTSRR